MKNKFCIKLNNIRSASMQIEIDGWKQNKKNLKFWFSKLRQNSVQVPGYRFSQFVGDQVITHPNLILHFKYSIAASSCAFSIFSPSMSCHFSLFSAHGGGKKLQLIYMLSWFGFQLLNSGAAITKKNRMIAISTTGLEMRLAGKFPRWKAQTWRNRY